MRRILTLFCIIIALTSCDQQPSQPRTENASPHSEKLVPQRDNALYNVALNKTVDSLCAVKHLRELSVYRKGELIKIYRFALGDTPVGHKHFQGDEKTPEGLYFINDRSAESICHKNLGISYPNNSDRAYARKHNRPTGGDIKIHGLPNGKGYIGSGHLAYDWTNGCLGVTDEEVDELFVHVRKGAPILILP